MYIVLAILIFGILIATHELGHFLTAKACGVQVNEFAVGLGPAILKKKRGETQYSLRILPLGGFCAMEGEDSVSENPRAFTSQPVWKRFLILVSGAAMNFLTGLLVVLLLFSRSEYFVGSTVTDLAEGFRYGGEQGLMVGDEIVRIDGHAVWYVDDFQTYMSRSDGTVDMTVLRGGRRVELKDYPLQMEEFDVDGETVTRYGITFNIIRANLWEKFKYGCYTAYDFVRLVYMSLGDLLRGAVGVNELSGVVGIVDTISQVGQQSATRSAALLNIAYLAAFIAVNLAVMNLLPIPALDGGRIFFLLVTWVLEKILGRKIDPKYEGYIHAAGLVLLLLLMAYVMFNDIVRIVHGT